MATKKGFGITKIIKTIFVMVPALFSFVTHLAVLMKYEARLAGKSFVLILILLLMVLVLLTTTWFCVLAMLYLYFTVHFLWTPIMALWALVSINVLLLIIMGMIIWRVKNNLFFPETCYQLSQLRQTREDL